MKMILLPVAIFVLLALSLGGWWGFIHDNTYVIGGEYVINNGDIVKGDLNLIFAQVEMENGGRVDGRILSFSSALDLNGVVSGDILAIGSDIQVEKAAQLREAPREVDAFPYVVLLPRMARIGVASER